MNGHLTTQRIKGSKEATHAHWVKQWVNEGAWSHATRLS